jgi:hypothetical protein
LPHKPNGERSYAAYTPELQAKNVEHLSGSGAPDTVFFTFAPIFKLPQLEIALTLVV